MGPRTAHRAGAALAIAAPFLLVWLILAVGLLAEEGHPADRLYLGVVGVLVGGAVVAGRTARLMVRACLAAAAAQTLIAVLAIANGVQHSPATSVLEILGVNAIFVVLFGVAAWLFRRASSGDAGEAV